MTNQKWIQLNAFLLTYIVTNFMRVFIFKGVPQVGQKKKQIEVGVCNCHLYLFTGYL
jgi:hypothetical protein